MIFTVQTKFKSIENDSKDRIKEIKDIESVFFNLENNKEDIKIKRINRTKYILNEISKWRCIDIDNAIENIKTLDSKFPGKNYLYELKLGNKTMTYSDEFIENMLKDEYIKHLKDEQDKIDAMKQLKELDIKVPSMEELKEICDMGYDISDINKFISNAYKDWDMKPCSSMEYLKESL